ncbi:NUDIX domain-containing protein [Patescibacteria group bacterium]
MKQKLKKVICAGGIVRKINSGKVYLLLIRDASKPKWVFPKGHVEKGETIEYGAEREVREETGLVSVKLVRKLGREKRFSSKKHEFKTIHYFLFDSHIKMKSKKLHLEDNKTWEVKWFSLDNLPELFWLEQKRILFRNIKNIREV